MHCLQLKIYVTRMVDLQNNLLMSSRRKLSSAPTSNNYTILLHTLYLCL